MNELIAGAGSITLHGFGQWLGYYAVGYVLALLIGLIIAVIITAVGAFVLGQQDGD